MNQNEKKRNYKHSPSDQCLHLWIIQKGGQALEGDFLKEEGR